jgi:hypothetical protein
MRCFRAGHTFGVVYAFSIVRSRRAVYILASRLFAWYGVPVLDLCHGREGRQVLNGYIVERIKGQQPVMDFVIGTECGRFLLDAVQIGRVGWDLMILQKMSRW